MKLNLAIFDLRFGNVWDQCENVDLICLEPAEKMFIGGGQDEFSQPYIGCHKDATSIISLVSANQKFSANFV